MCKCASNKNKDERSSSKSKCNAVFFSVAVASDVHVFPLCSHSSLSRNAQRNAFPYAMCPIMQQAFNNFLSCSSKSPTNLSTVQHITNETTRKLFRVLCEWIGCVHLKVTSPSHSDANNFRFFPFSARLIFSYFLPNNQESRQIKRERSEKTRIVQNVR